MEYDRKDRENLEKLVSKANEASVKVDEMLARIESIEDRIEAYMRNPKPIYSRVKAISINERA